MTSICFFKYIDLLERPAAQLLDLTASNHYVRKNISVGTRDSTLRVAAGGKEVEPVIETKTRIYTKMELG